MNSIFARFGLGRASHVVPMEEAGIVLTGAKYANGGEARAQLRIGASGAEDGQRIVLRANGEGEATEAPAQ
jgi:hypothetical protein